MRNLLKIMRRRTVEKEEKGINSGIIMQKMVCSALFFFCFQKIKKIKDLIFSFIFNWLCDKMGKRKYFIEKNRHYHVFDVFKCDALLKYQQGICFVRWQ